MQDRPNANELIEAVAGFLQRELVPTVTDPRLRFRALVAANVLSIVARELQVGSEPLRAEWQGVARILGRTDEPPADDRTLREAILAMNREWCRHIRAGEMDAEPLYSTSLEQATAIVIDKLRVANPRYLERLKVQ